MAGGPIDFWNAWAVQILVLVSLTLQVALLLLAGIRQRQASWRLFRFILWLAYQLADATAIYALGHLSFNGAAPREHRLVVFWAPFILLHLGGPDNITAYTLEDNRLWLRHLLTLGLQVLGAAYVLYKHYIVTQDVILLASILMFVVGVLKCGERTWALKCSNMDSIRGSLMESRTRCHFYLEDRPPHGGFKGKVDEEEFLMRHAHSLFHICKRAIVDLSEDMDLYNPEIKVLENLTWEQRYVVMELELSLLYDILYTKAAVVHTLFGYCVCIISPAATATSLLLFQFSGKADHSRLDVAITYILLCGALLLEIRSLLSALVSCWTLAFLCGTRWNWLQHAVLCAGRWGQFRRWIVSFHQLIKVMRLDRCFRSARRWSGTVGQCNMLQLCSRPRKGNSAALARFANMLGIEEWLDWEHHSWTVKFPEDLKQKLMKHIDELVSREKLSTQRIVRKWGKGTLEMCDLYANLKGSLGVEFQEGIIIWHIATDLFLNISGKETKFEPMEDKSLYEAVRLLSNYLMFLLVERPDMLPGQPGLAQSRMYQRTCDYLVDIWSKVDKSCPAPSCRNLFRLYNDPKSRSNDRRELAGMVLFFMWRDFLVHAANRCSRESHAKKLSSGGELTTILWLLTEHLDQLVKTKIGPYPRAEVPNQGHLVRMTA